jgi:nucleoside 2-deoxyribosyltransferase
MLEGEAVVKARRVVYDPQNPVHPRWFDETGSAADEILYVLNRREGSLLTGEDAPEEIIRSVLDRPGVKGCALKLGPRGALVGDSDGKIQRIPCYRTERVWPIGSGDVFASVMAWASMTRGLDPAEAAEAGSRAVALYCTSGAIPSRRDLILGEAAFPHPVAGSADTTGKRVYLAGPFFSLQDRWVLEETRSVLSGFGLEVFSPLHDVGEGEGEEVAPKDLDALRGSAQVFALLETLDPGTVFEIGFARAIGVPVVAYAGDAPDGHLKMLKGTDCAVESDYTTALYRSLWDLLAS